MEYEKGISFYITDESPHDLPGIRSVNLAAFDSEGEADVIDQLPKTCSSFFSFVAKINEKVVGHILFTPVRLVQNEGWTIEGMGLAPLAVLPEYQNQGIGSALCNDGLTYIETSGYSFVVVIGDPSYYSRFGFKPASDFGINSVYTDVPSTAFMIKIFKPEVLLDVQGVVYYQKEFDQIT
jgi:putative acetyltransferase